MEPIPKHEQKRGMLTSDLYQMLVEHPENVNKLIDAITSFDKATLYSCYLSELWDDYKGKDRQESLRKLYYKSTELQASLRNLNDHIAGNTTIDANVNGFEPPRL